MYRHLLGESSQIVRQQPPSPTGIPVPLFKRGVTSCVEDLGWSDPLLLRGVQWTSEVCRQESDLEQAEEGQSSGYAPGPSVPPRLCTRGPASLWEPLTLICNWGNNDTYLNELKNETFVLGQGTGSALAGHDASPGRPSDERSRGPQSPLFPFVCLGL